MKEGDRKGRKEWEGEGKMHHTFQKTSQNILLKFITLAFYPMLFCNACLDMYVMQLTEHRVLLLLALGDGHPMIMATKPAENGVARAYCQLKSCKIQHKCSTDCT